MAGRRARGLRERRPGRLLDLPRLDRHRPAAASRERDRRADRAPFRVGPPLVATSRIVDPVEADRLVGGGRCDATGMTRALITDPELPLQAREGRLDESSAASLATRACAPLPRGHPDRVRAEPAHRARADAGPPARSAARRRVVVVGGGRRASPRPRRRERRGTVVLLERGGRLGGRLRSPARRRCTPSSRARSLATTTACSGPPGRGPPRRRRRRGERRRRSRRRGRRRRGRAPFDPDLPLAEVETVQAWDVLRGPRPRGRRVVVADWERDAAGLACAELLDAAGNDVTVAVGSAALGETLHQYQRNLYAAQLYRAGVRLEHHLELVGAERGRVLFRNLSSRPSSSRSSGRPPRPRARPGPRARGCRGSGRGRLDVARPVTASALEASRGDPRGTLAAQEAASRSR